MQDYNNVINQDKRVFLFIGEAGSGKSEIAINFAIKLADEGKNVRFYDMDQTKPIFRSREAVGVLKENGVHVDDFTQFLDSPVIPHGVFDRLSNRTEYTVLDVGGNISGAKTLGQFANAWGEHIASFLVINPYRSLSYNIENLIYTIELISNAARVKDLIIVSNPNLGENTTLENIIEGQMILEELFEKCKYNIDIIVSQFDFIEQLKKVFPNKYVFPIKRFIKAPWE